MRKIELDRDAAQQYLVELVAKIRRIHDGVLVLSGIAFCIQADDARKRHAEELFQIAHSADRIDYVMTAVLDTSDEVAPEVVAYDEQPDVELLPLAEVEKQHILRVLEACNNNKTQSAKILGIERSTLDRKLKLYKSAEQTESETKGE